MGAKRNPHVQIDGKIRNEAVLRNVRKTALLKKGSEEQGFWLRLGRDSGKKGTLLIRGPYGVLSRTEDRGAQIFVGIYG